MLIATVGLMLQLAAAAGPSAVDHAARQYVSQLPEGSDVPLAAPPQPRRSIFELNHELQRLERERPGLGFPIAFIAVGGGILVLEGLFTLSLYGLFGASTATSILASLYPLLIVAGVVALAAFAGVGVMVLVIRLHQRKGSEARIEEIREELRGRESEHPYNLQREELPPLPPPPPPPPVGFAPAPAPQLVLARF